MTPETTQAAGLFDRPCITAFTTEVRCFTVAEYDALQRQLDYQPLWVRRAPRVEHLTTEPGHYDVRITDQKVYEAQMWALLGLPELAARSAGRSPRSAPTSAH